MLKVVLGVTAVLAANAAQAATIGIEAGQTVNGRPNEGLFSNYVNSLGLFTERIQRQCGADDLWRSTQQYCDLQPGYRRCRACERPIYPPRASARHQLGLDRCRACRHRPELLFVPAQSLEPSQPGCDGQSGGADLQHRSWNADPVSWLVLG